MQARLGKVSCLLPLYMPTYCGYGLEVGYGEGIAICPPCCHHVSLMVFMLQLMWETHPADRRCQYTIIRTVDVPSALGAFVWFRPAVQERQIVVHGRGH